jgi:hypothetical protein
MSPASGACRPRGEQLLPRPGRGAGALAGEAGVARGAGPGCFMSRPGREAAARQGKKLFPFLFSRNFSNNFNSQFENSILSKKMIFPENGPKMKVA